MKRRILSIITALALCLFPAGALAVESPSTPTRTTELILGPTTGENAGEGWKWEKHDSTYTLTLTDANIEVADNPAIQFAPALNGAEVNVVLVGANRVVSNGEHSYDYGIYNEILGGNPSISKITFSGGGSLEVSSQSGGGMYFRQATVIFDHTDITVSSVKTPIHTNVSDLEIKGGTLDVTLKNSGSAAIDAGNLSITDGATVTIDTAYTGISGTYNIIVDNSAVTVRGAGTTGNGITYANMSNTSSKLAITNSSISISNIGAATSTGNGNGTTEISDSRLDINGVIAGIKGNNSTHTAAITGTAGSISAKTAWGWYHTAPTITDCTLWVEAAGDSVARTSIYGTHTLPDGVTSVDNLYMAPQSSLTIPANRELTIQGIDANVFNAEIINNGILDLGGEASYSLAVKANITNNGALNINADWTEPQAPLTNTESGTINISKDKILYVPGTVLTNHGTITGEGTLRPKLATDISSEDRTVVGTAPYDLSQLFTIPAMAGAATYMLEAGGTGTGSISGTTLTVATPGTFPIKVQTAETAFCEAGEQSATLTVTPYTRYAVTVNGSYAATSGEGSYEANTTVTIDAGSRSSYLFDGWTVSAGVTLANASSAQTTFTMPDQNVTVTANWKEDAPPAVTKYTVTVNGSYAAASGEGSYAANATVAIDAGSRSNYVFNGWTSSDGIIFSDAGSPSTTFPMPNHAVTVTACWTYTGGISGGGDGYIPLPTDPPVDPPTYPPAVEKPGEGGDVIVTPRNPEKGETVTVTPRPDEGYRVDEIAVTGENGMPVNVVKNSDGTYSFVQPSGKVNIHVTYTPVEIPWRNPFVDVSEGDWYHEAVDYVLRNGLMNGYTNETFGPNDYLTRAQFAQILYNKEGRPVVNYLLQHSDVAADAWYTEAVRWATSQGVVGGYGDGRFGPNDNITREQLAVMLWRYAGSPAATNKELQFADADQVSGYALEAMRWAVENGVMGGYGDGWLVPGGLATRAQVAQMLMNLLRK